MKRLLAALLLLVPPVAAQEFSSKQIREYHNALTGAGRFGAPGYTTVLLPTCNAANARAIAWDSTALTLKVCNGTSYTAIGAVAVGGAITGGTNNTVLYIDNTGLMGSEAALGYVASTDTLSAVNTSFANVSLTNQSLLGSGATYGIGVGNNDVVLGYSTVNTPDASQVRTGTTSNSLNVLEAADAGSDFNNGPCGTATCTDPQIVVHSHNIDVTQYAGLSAFGITGGGKKALPDTTATDVFRVTVASDTGTGGIVVFTDFASDGTIQQTLSGVMQFSAVAEGTTETCPTPTAVGTNLNAVTAGTLTCAFTCDVTPTNAVDIQFGCNPSLTLGTQTLTYQVFLTGPGEVLPQ